VWVIFLAVAALFLLPLVLHLREIPFQPGAEYSDLLISHLPNSLFINRSLRQWRQIPLWNPTILSGMPLAADPLSGFWYAPNWLAHLWPTPEAYKLLLWLHLAWAGFGMFILARDEGLGDLPALFSGVVAAGMPKIVAHIGMGHVSLIFAVSWTPWLLVAVRRGVAALQGGVRPALRWGFTAGAIEGVVFLADPRWAPFAALFGTAYGLRAMAPWKRSTLRTWRNALALVFGAVVTGAAACGALGLPLVELTRLSTRANLGPGERAIFSLPATRIFGLFLPDFGGLGEYQIYVGLVALVLAVFAVAVRPRRTLFWALSAFVALVYSLGEATPLYGWLEGLIPGMNLLRVPSRALFLLGFCMAFTGGFGMHLWISRSWNPLSARRGRLAIVSLTFFLVLLSIGAAWPGLGNGGSSLSLSLFVSIFALLAAGLLLVGMRERGADSRLLPIALVLLASLDLAWVDRSFIEMRPAALRSPTAESALDGCPSNGGARLFSPSYSVPQAYAAYHGLQIADGVNPLQLSNYWDYMAAATGFPAHGYSVTLPPFPSGDPTQNWDPDIDSRALARLNISCVVSSFLLDDPGMTLIHAEAGRYSYRLAEAGSRAWIQTGGEDAGIDIPARVEGLEWSPNRIQIRARGPGQLVLSEVDYPGWIAQIDGERVEIASAFGLLRSLDLPAGLHTVRLDYRPWTVFFGAALLMAAALLVLYSWVRR
jgi:hypothetical protein